MFIFFYLKSILFNINTAALLSLWLVFAYFYVISFNLSRSLNVAGISCNSMSMDFIFNQYGKLSFN